MKEKKGIKEATKAAKGGRLLSLDILRGITIAGMILVNNPGSWGHIYAPLRHAPWHGLTPTDLVFPFFMFIMGVSAYFSLKKYDFTMSKSLLWKILRRTVVIYLIGIGIGWFSHFCYTLSRGDEALTFWQLLGKAANNLDGIRILGVMPRLALCYCAASLIAVLVKHKFIPWITAGILVVYAVLLLCFHGLEFSTESIIYVVDSTVLGTDHMYSGLHVDGVNIPFDPEGLMSNLPAVAHVLIGFLVGQLLTKIRDNRERVMYLFIVGFALMLSGWLLSYGMPINKQIWTSTFAITTCGMAASLLAFLVWVIDICGKTRWCRFFESFGINPLFMFVMGGVMSILFGSIKLPYGEDMVSIHSIIYAKWLIPLCGEGGENLASCLYALIFVGFIWCIGYKLYKNKIYIKI